MICPATESVSNGEAELWHADFLGMLPAVRRQASMAFRGLPAETREDLIAEVVAQVLVAVKRLHDQGRLSVASPSSLAAYAIRRVKVGRKVGTRMNIKDVSSEHCQLAKRVRLDRLDRFDRDTGEWREVLVEDRHAGPAETAAARIDVRDWFQRMSPRDRRIAGALASGGCTGEVARKFHLSAGRISQKRREFLESWREFQGEEPTANRAAQAVA